MSEFTSPFCEVLTRRRSGGCFDIVGEGTGSASLACALKEELARYELRVCILVSPTP